MRLYVPQERMFDKPLLGRQIDYGHPLAAGLAWIAPMLECEGTATLEHHGRIEMAVASPLTWSDGAVTYTGSSGYIQLSSQSIANPQSRPHTMLCIYRNNAGDTGSRCLVGENQVGAGNNYLQMTLNQSVAGRVRAVGMSGGATRYDVSANLSANDGEWHISAVACDGPGLGVRLYHDGRLVAATTSTGALGNYTGGSIGAWQGATPSMIHLGQIALAAMWLRSLSEEEMAWLAVEPWAIYQPAPVDWWGTVSSSTGGGGTTVVARRNYHASMVSHTYPH